MSEFFENLPPLFFYSDHFSILHYPSEMPQFRYQGGVGHVFNHPSAISTWRGWWKWLDEQRFLKPSTSLRNLAHQISHGGHILILILRSREVNRSIERRRRRMRTFEATFQQRLLPSWRRAELLLHRSGSKCKSFSSREQAESWLSVMDRRAVEKLTSVTSRTCFSQKLLTPGRGGVSIIPRNGYGRKGKNRIFFLKCFSAEKTQVNDRS